MVFRASVTGYRPAGIGDRIDRSASSQSRPNLRSVPYAEFLEDLLGVSPRRMKTDAARVGDFLRRLARRETARNLDLSHSEAVLLLQRRIGKSRVRSETNQSHSDSQLGAE